MPTPHVRPCKPRLSHNSSNTTTIRPPQEKKLYLFLLYPKTNQTTSTKRNTLRGKKATKKRLKFENFPKPFDKAVVSQKGNFECWKKPNAIQFVPLRIRSRLKLKIAKSISNPNNKHVTELNKISGSPQLKIKIPRRNRNPIKKEGNQETPKSNLTKRGGWKP